MKMKYLLPLILAFATHIESQIFNSKAIVHPEVGENGMVVSQHYLATDVGHSILKSGGNAYDASIAVAFALAVVLPRAGNIGGGGFMVMFDNETQCQQMGLDELLSLPPPNQIKGIEYDLEERPMYDAETIKTLQTSLGATLEEDGNDFILKCKKHNFKVNDSWDGNPGVLIIS